MLSGFLNCSAYVQSGPSMGKVRSPLLLALFILTCFWAQLAGPKFPFFPFFALISLLGKEPNPLTVKYIISTTHVKASSLQEGLGSNV